MKLIRHITDLNKAINKENELGFIPTMGSLHKGHEYLINQSKKLCKKTLVSIFVNPTQFNNMKDYKTYPRDLIKDLKILKRLKVNFVYLPTTKQIYKKKLSKINLNNSQKILCAKFRKGHFEGVLNILNRFLILISPKMMFMGEKDHQQFHLVKNYFFKKYKTKVYPCKTIRLKNGMALSSRNILLSKNEIKTGGLIAKTLMKTKNKLNKINYKKTKKLVGKLKNNLQEKFNIKIEYLECRNLINLGTNIKNKPFKLFVSYYLNKVRIIDNF